MAEVFLAVIAVSVLVMALIQVGALVAGFKLMRRVEQVSHQLEQDIKPLIANLASVASEAARSASLASKQVERVDQLFGEVATRVDETLAVAQKFVQGPARNGMALLTGVQAAFSAFRGIRESSRRRKNARPGVDDDDSLFIG
jgi:ABC-type transporter Mla subunit MlaD